jgi:hypothetical protein
MIFNGTFQIKFTHLCASTNNKCQEKKTKTRSNLMLKEKRANPDEPAAAERLNSLSLRREIAYGCFLVKNVDDLGEKYCALHTMSFLPSACYYHLKKGN